MGVDHGTERQRGYAAPRLRDQAKLLAYNSTLGTKDSSSSGSNLQSVEGFT